MAVTSTRPAQGQRERPIRYTRTSDGVSIAWSEDGVGHPLVVVTSPPLTHVAMNWNLGLENLTRSFRVVTYDSRGFGLSERGALDLTMDAMMLDLDAVVAATGAFTVALVGTWASARIALHYAARRPERVSHLFLLNASVSNADVEGSVFLPFVEATKGQDWDLFTAAYARIHVDDESAARALTEMIRASASKEAFQALWVHEHEWDATAVFGEIEAPTLAYLAGSHGLPPETTRNLVSGIRDCKLVMGGEQPQPADVARLLHEFVYGEWPAPAPTQAGRTAVNQPLSSREREVLGLIAVGKTNLEIAHVLTIAPATASRHVHNILEKLAMSRRSEAAAWWAANGHSKL